MRFDLVDLRLVLLVADAASITHGAARAGMALASASERIRAMEQALGAPLFERRRRGVTPTPAGTALLHHARAVTQQIERMRGDLDQYAKGLRGRIRVYSNTAATLEFLPRSLGAFLAAHPNVDIDLEERPSAEIVRAVAAGRADIGIVADAVDPAAELQTNPYVEDRLVLIAPPRHPLAKRRRLAFREALAYDFVGLAAGSALQDHIEGHAARAGHQLRLRVRLPGFDAVCRVVESGIGLAVVPRAAAERCRRSMAIRPIALSDPWALRHLRICVRDLGALPAHAQRLVGHLGGISRAA
ncbi:MAG: LysR family transcriptional regulator [Reyranella sp.]|nr:LysR family transcriptional regulator [Reyranella sp.]